MKKTINYIFIFILTTILNIVVVNAGSLSVSASDYSLNVGDSVKVYAKASSLTGAFTYSSSNSTVLSGGCNDQWLENNTGSCTFKAKKTGTAKIIVKATNAADSSTGKDFTGSKSISITVTTKSNKNNNNNNNNKNASSNNNLKNLTLSQGTLNPKFSKDITEYKIEVENNIEKIKISAQAEDNKSEIRGLGEKKLKVGKNSFGVVVVAENGKTKTYTLVVDRKEENPIYVTINNKKYKVVRKLDGIEKPLNFQEQTIKIQNEDIVALYDNITKYTLIALMDENNNIKLYICDVDKEEYELFIETKLSENRIQILSMPKKLIPKGYKKYKETIDNIEYDVYKLNRKSDYSLIYALNLNSGKKELYRYDSYESTIQRFNDEDLKEKEKDYDSLFKITIGLCALLIVIVISIFISIMRKSSNKKRNNNEE